MGQDLRLPTLLPSGECMKLHQKNHGCMKVHGLTLTHVGILQSHHIVRNHHQDHISPEGNSKQPGFLLAHLKLNKK